MGERRARVTVAVERERKTGASSCLLSPSCGPSLASSLLLPSFPCYLSLRLRFVRQKVHTRPERQQLPCPAAPDSLAWRSLSR